VSERVKGFELNEQRIALVYVATRQTPVLAVPKRP